MKEKTGFLGTVYGVNLYADTKDDIVMEAIVKYFEEQRRALVHEEIKTAILEQKLNKAYWLLGAVCVTALVFIWL